MEEDILNYSPTVMFRGTPCMFQQGYPEQWDFRDDSTEFKLSVN